MMGKTRGDIRLYHVDHLGSTALVTDIDGEITQHVAYIPYGEVFVEERNGSWSTPYLFNAKELDEETGLYYYGARYLDPTNAAWLSVDPLFEKYVGMTPYGYCAGNPVGLVDPDGEEIGVSDNGEFIQYNPEIKVNKYHGKNNFIKMGGSVLNKINSLKMGHKLLMSLHTSKNKYIITNNPSIDGTLHTKPTYDKNKNFTGASISSSNRLSLLTASHELFHCYQYEKGQGGCSIFNEIEAYTFSNRLINAFNVSLDNDELFSDFEQNDGFCLSQDNAMERTLRPESKEYERATNSLVNGNDFNEKDFISALKYFRAYSSMNSDGLYYRKSYKYISPKNKRYLIPSFYK